MKKWTLFLGLYFCLCLLAACASNGSGVDPVPGGTPTEPNPNHTDTTTQESPQSAMVTETFRVVTAEEPGHPALLLAKVDGASGEVYLLPSGKEIPVTLEWVSEEETKAIDWSYHAGSLVEITHNGMILETYPAQFSSIAAIHVLEGGFDDRCAIYLDVLEALWEKDSGLNSDLTHIGVDLSQTSLTPAEQSAVAWAFAKNHGAGLVQGTLDELAEQGYITAEPISATGSGTDLNDPEFYFYEWKDGCHFSITEQPMEGTYSLTPVTFDVQKWRSSLGAYWLCDCTALQTAVGKWSDYTIGSEMIS